MICNDRKVLAEASAYNPQIAFGDDVISRIVYSQKPGALSALQQVVVEALNGIIHELIEKAGIAKPYLACDRCGQHGDDPSPLRA